MENLFFAYIITREPTKGFEQRFTRWARELRKVTSRKELDDFVARYFTPPKEELRPRFELAFRELTEYSLQKYRLRYVLAKLTQHVNERAYGSVESDLSKFIKADIEHILPQTPKPAARAAFDRQDEIEDWIRRFGNLTLLEGSIDSSIGNELFVDKCAAYQQSQYLLTKTIAQPVVIGVNTAIDRAVQGLKHLSEWTSESIEARQQMLGKLAKIVWDVP